MKNSIYIGVVQSIYITTIQQTIFNYAHAVNHGSKYICPFLPQVHFNIYDWSIDGM